MESWKFGLKAVAIYRDNSKRSQPLSAAGKKEDDKAAVPAKVAVCLHRPRCKDLSRRRCNRRFPPVPSSRNSSALRARRKKLPAERNSITHKFSVGGHEGYITVGKYDDGKPGEIFIKMAKEGSTLSGIMDAFALSVSIALQYGVPLRALVDKFCNSRFEPSGYTGNPKIRYAKSVVDYIGRWLGGKFISPDYLDHDERWPERGVEVAPTREGAPLHRRCPSRPRRKPQRVLARHWRMRRTAPSAAC